MLWLLLACGNTDSDKQWSATPLHLMNWLEDFCRQCLLYLSLESSILGEGDVSVSWTETEHGFQPINRIPMVSLMVWSWWQYTLWRGTTRL